MKTILSPVRLIALLAFVTLGASCTTTYDSYGNPRQSVDPGVALMGVAAAGIVGYALADDNGHDTHYSQNHYYEGRPRYYRSRSYGYSSSYYDGGHYHCY